MTQKELLSLDHLSIAEVKKFVHIHTEDGYVMTSWKDGDDVKEYAGSVCYYMPIRDDYDDYRVITKEEHNEYEKLRDEAVQAEVEAMRNKTMLNE